jgi:serine/threonine protein kinase/TolB-like protein
MIDIDRYRRIDEIFQAALELESRERALFISEACSGDAALLKEVEYLLASDGQQWELIGTPAFEMVAPLLAKDQPALEAGDSIGHYQVVSLLGVGGMGQVYLAEDAKLRRKVALKLLPASYTRDESRLRRFQQEARAASALNHPNILTIHELGEVNGEQFIATEFVEGETLRERLNRAPLNLAETLDVAVQIAGALAAAHKAGIVHRDIKPENIMLRHDGYVKVLDFGLAKLTEQREPATQTAATENVDISSGLVMGTVKYMSPEQAVGRQVDPRSDIFSFGVVLYEMIAGRPPFAGKNSDELISTILKKEPSPLTDVPEETQRLVSRALRKKKEDRYQTIEELLADLKSLKEDKTVTNVGAQHQRGRWTGSAFSTRKVAAISTATTIEYVIREIKRHKTATALGFVTLVILLAGVGYLGYRYFFSRRLIDSIAVMPFVNESGDPELEYLSDGMTEDLITSLRKIPGLSVFRYKGKNTDATTIGKELNAQAVLSGRIVKYGEDFRLHVELVDARTRNLVFEKSYNRKLSNLIALKQEFTGDLARTLRVKLGADQQKKYTESDTAYQLYLKGLIESRKLTPPEINRGIEDLQQAINNDPSYALAYAAIARAHISLAMGGEAHPSEFEKAKSAALKAIEIDDSLAEGHSALAYTIFVYNWRFAEAEKEFTRALELDPNSCVTHRQYADFLGKTGHREESRVHHKRALEIEPMEPWYNVAVANGTDGDAGLERMRSAIALDPKFYFAHMMAGVMYNARKMYPEAIEEERLAKTLSPTQTYSDVFLVNALINTGKRDEARAILDEVLTLSKSRFVRPYHIASIYNLLGDKEQALAWLEKGYQIHDPGLTLLKLQSSTIWKSLQDDPRFQDILHRVGF